MTLASIPRELVKPYDSPRADILAVLSTPNSTRWGERFFSLVILFTALAISSVVVFSLVLLLPESLEPAVDNRSGLVIAAALGFAFTVTAMGYAWSMASRRLRFRVIFHLDRLTIGRGMLSKTIAYRHVILVRFKTDRHSRRLLRMDFHTIYGKVYGLHVPHRDPWDVTEYLELVGELIPDAVRITPDNTALLSEHSTTPWSNLRHTARWYDCWYSPKILVTFATAVFCFMLAAGTFYSISQGKTDFRSFSSLMRYSVDIIIGVMSLVVLVTSGLAIRRELARRTLELYENASAAEREKVLSGSSSDE